MRRPDATSWKYDRPAGVIFFFQVRENKVKPSGFNRCANLFSIDRCRSALPDKPKPLGPQVPGVGKSFLLSGAGKGLTGTTTCPHRSIVWPSGLPEGKGPDSDTGEEEMLGKSHKVIWRDFTDRSAIHLSWGNRPLFN
jgi:hypothetical protein